MINPSTVINNSGPRRCVITMSRLCSRRHLDELAEALSDDGSLTGGVRPGCEVRGVTTAIGGLGHRALSDSRVSRSFSTRCANSVIAALTGAEWPSRVASATTRPLRSSTSLRRPLIQSCNTVVFVSGEMNPVSKTSSVVSTTRLDWRTSCGVSPKMGDTG